MSKFDCALIDIRYPKRSAIDVGQRLLAGRMVPKVILLDHHHCSVRARLAREVNAAYCSRSISLIGLLSVTRKLAKNEQLNSSELRALNLDKVSERTDQSHATKVTDREMEIWTLIGEGYSVAECAEILGIALSTADNHKSRLMKKIKVKKSLELVRMAVRLGMVEP